MPIAVGLVVVVAIVGIVAAVIVVTTYNSVVALRRRTERAWANVDVALKQRWDELPNLVAAVQGQLGFERGVLDEVSRLRAAYAPTAPIGEQAETAEATSRALRSLFAVVERYPELRSQGNVAALQAEIQRLETLIARRRELFNEQVYQYNATIQQLPAVLLAGIFGWRARPFFAIPGPDRARPDARLGVS